MPIYIYKDRKRIGECAVEEWELPTQIYELEQWLNANHHSLPKGSYRANIDYLDYEGRIDGYLSYYHEGSTFDMGDDAVISSAMSGMMNDIDMTICFSGYTG